MKRKITILCFVFTSLFIQSKAQDLTMDLSNWSFNYDQNTNVITLVYDLVNNGSSSGPFHVGYYLSTDLNCCDGDYLLFQDYTSTGLGYQQYFHITFNVDIDTVQPAVPTGNYRLLVYADNLEEVTETNENNNLVAFGTSINYTSSSGISETSNANKQISIFPNPSSGKFKIDTKITEGEISIYNVLGEKIYSTINNKQATYDIDLSNSSKGIYFVKIYDGEKIHTEKIVIQ